jgi:hypothetical protein
MGKQIDVKITYDAGRLAKKMPNMIKQLIKDYTIQTGNHIKSNIFTGEVSPDIRKTTKRIRRKRGQLGSPPLFASGKLYKSIKVKELKTGAKISMLLYGALHHKGYNTAPNSMIPRKKVPKRPWITPKKGTLKRLTKGLGKNISQKFKKKGIGVSFK